jgi:hypothetical protein
VAAAANNYIRSGSGRSEGGRGIMVLVFGTVFRKWGNASRPTITCQPNSKKGFLKNIQKRSCHVGLGE